VPYAPSFGIWDGEVEPRYMAWTVRTDTFRGSMSTNQSRKTAAQGRSRTRRPPMTGVLGVFVAGALAAVLLGCGGQRSARRLTACAGENAPKVQTVAAQELSRLRSSVVRVLPQRVGRLYEEGTIEGSNFWTDANPSGPTVSPTARRPGGYEMRWWAPNGDDLVADVLVFANPATAAHFMEQAAGARCGHVALASNASRPPQARNLAWLNPDHVAEADVYLARGSRVYRVADAPSGQIRGDLSPARIRRTLSLINTLACLLPEAHCSSVNRNVPA